MRSRRLLVAPILLAALVLGRTGRPDDDEDASPPATPADITSAVAVFARLPIPSVKEKRFVRIKGGPAGWLLDEKPDQIELLSTGLVRQRLKPAGELETIDFEKEVTEFAAGSADRYFGFGAMEHARGGGMGRHTEACLFAYWERERGHVEIAQKLEALAGRAFGKLRKEFAKAGPATLEMAVADDVATNIRWKAINDANGGVPRPELLERWKLIESLPHTSLSDEARAMTKAYTSLIEEDSKWHELAPAELATKPVGDQVAYWMHRLRDHAARQWSQPGGVSVLGEMTGLPEGTKNPADELAKIGWEAVPALVEGIGDGRPTRCMGFWRDFAPGSYYLLTIGDCCESIFAAITGERLYERASTSGAMTKDGRAQGVQKAAREWWRKFGATDEKTFLIKSVASGDRDGVGRAGRLIERFPAEAYVALLNGLAAAKDEDVRAYLVGLLGGLEKVDTTALMKEEAAADRPLTVRIAATRALLRRGHRDALAPLIEVWRKEKSDGGELLGFLVGSGEPAAIRALGEDFGRHPLRVRVTILECLDRSRMHFRVDSEPTAHGPAEEPDDKTRQAEWERAVEDVLVGALDDEAEETGVSGSRDGKSYKDPRVCDEAGQILWTRWPERYAFDLSEPVADKDRKIASIKAAWRRTRGLPALDRGWRDTPPADPAKMNAALDALARASDAERPAEMTAVEAIGLGGLGAIESRIAASEPPLRGVFERVAVRVSTTVVDTVLDAGSLPADEAWRARLDALRGHPIDARDVAKLLGAAASGLPEKARGLRVIVERPSDASGVLVRVMLAADVGEPSSAAHDTAGRALPQADRTLRAELGSETIVSLSVGGLLEAAKAEDGHAAARSALERCLAAPPQTPFMLRATVSIFPGDPGATAPSGSVAAEPAAVRTDSRGDPLPVGARARFGSLRFRHTDSIDSLAWTPDGSAILAGDSAGELRVWDAKTGKELRRLVEFDRASWRSNTVECVAVSPDGKHVAAGNSDGKLRVWDLATGVKLLTAEHGDFVQSCGYSPDGKTIATGCWDGKIRLFDAKTGELKRSVSIFKSRKEGGSADGRPHLEWTRDGSEIVVAGVDEKLYAWKIAGEDVRAIPVLKKALSRVAVSPDGRLVAVGGYDKKVVLLDLEKGETVRVLETGKGEGYQGVWAIAFSPDGKTVVANSPGTVAILRWDVATGERQKPLLGSQDGVFVLAFSSDGRLASAARDQVVRVWDLAKGRQISPKEELEGRFGPLALAPDGSGLFIVASDRIHLLDLKDEDVTLRFDGHWAQGFAISPDGSRAVSGSWEDVTLWDASTGRPIHTFDGTKRHVRATAFAPDGDMFAAGDSGRVRLFSAKQKKLIRTIEMGYGEASQLAFSPDGKLLAGGLESSRVTLWDVESGEAARTLEDFKGQCVAFTPDGKLLASGGHGYSSEGRGGTLNLSDPSTGKLVRSVETGEPIVAIAMSADGRFVAVGGMKGGVSVWNVETLANVARFTGHAGWIGGLAFTKDGKTLYSSGKDGTVLVWDVVERRFK